jgi:ATP-dependent Lhr-like helicase
MTTPESLALLISYPDAAQFFAGLACVVVDELHALADSKRGDLLALGLARLATLAPGHRRVGLSATVAEPRRLMAWLARGAYGGLGEMTLVEGRAGARAELAILEPEDEIPWAGHVGRFAVAEIYRRIEQAKTALVFVNTRAQAEIMFQELWAINEANLPIALHHGSLDIEQRRKVEAAMARGGLRAVVATSSLDLGIDWAAVDLVVQVGAPKGASRLLQRIGRANHRLDEPSRALLVPANRFEVLECRAAVEAVKAMELDAPRPKPGGLDVLAQHLLGLACADPFDADRVYAEVTGTLPYAGLTRADFDDVLRFVENGGYALRSYDRFRRLVKGKDGLWRIAQPRVAQQYRLNVGTIVQEPLIKVRMKNGRSLGEVEEYFIQGLTPGDTFLFAGMILTYLGMKETDALVMKGGADAPKVPAYAGARMPFTSELAARVRALLSDARRWGDLPAPVVEWLEVQRWRSRLPPADGLLVETFPRQGKEYLVAYSFAGRNAHQTLGMLLTRRMERLGLRPLGFVASDYVLAVWSVQPAEDLDALFSEDLLGDDLEEWMAESSLLRRTFRHVALIAGLIDRRRPGAEKSKRQMTVSSDLIYDVLRKYEPNHILLRATRQDAAGGLTDIRRLAELLARVKGKVWHQRLDRVSPLAVPVILEIGKEQVAGGVDALIDDAANRLIEEAMAPDRPGKGKGAARRHQGVLL